MKTLELNEIESVCSSRRRSSENNKSEFTTKRSMAAHDLTDINQPFCPKIFIKKMESIPKEDDDYIGDVENKHCSLPGELNYDASKYLEQYSGLILTPKEKSVILEQSKQNTPFVYKSKKKEEDSAKLQLLIEKKAEQVQTGKIREKLHKMKENIFKQMKLMDLTVGTENKRDYIIRKMRKINFGGFKNRNGPIANSLLSPLKIIRGRQSPIFIKQDITNRQCTNTNEENDYFVRTSKRRYQKPGALSKLCEMNLSPAQCKPFKTGSLSEEQSPYFGRSKTPKPTSMLVTGKQVPSRKFKGDRILSQISQIIEKLTPAHLDLLSNMAYHQQLNSIFNIFQENQQNHSNNYSKDIQTATEGEEIKVQFIQTSYYPPQKINYKRFTANNSPANCSISADYFKSNQQRSSSVTASRKNIKKEKLLLLLKSQLLERLKGFEAKKINESKRLQEENERDKIPIREFCGIKHLQDKEGVQKPKQLNKFIFNNPNCLSSRKKKSFSHLQNQTQLLSIHKKISYPHHWKHNNSIDYTNKLDRPTTSFNCQVGSSQAVKSFDYN